MPLVFLDTSFVVALDNAADPYHNRAARLASQFETRGQILVVHWGVLFEVFDGYARLSRRARGYELLSRITTERIYRVFAIKNDEFRAALTLYRNRPDKEWGLTDCVSFVLMRQLGISEALTADQHFEQAGFRALLLEKDEDKTGGV
jgi:predicted nucleic acid-binding protein